MSEIKIPKQVLIATKDLKLNDNNVKVHTETQINGLCELIKLVGFTDPVMIDKDLNVKAGKGSVLAAMQLKMPKVPCVYLENLSKKQIQAFMLMDNRINESPWNNEAVKDVLNNINFDFTPFSMTFDEFIKEPVAVVKEVDFQATEKSCPKCGYKF